MMYHSAFFLTFDIIDHSILFNKLSYYGLDGSTLNLFKSYLNNRSQYVEFEIAKSDILSTNIDVPQGAILGPTNIDVPQGAILGPTNIDVPQGAILGPTNIDVPQGAILGPTNIDVPQGAILGPTNIDVPQGAILGPTNIDVPQGAILGPTNIDVPQGVILGPGNIDVPQGAILGPGNDFQKVSKMFNFIMHVDDTTLFSKIKSLNDNIPNKSTESAVNDEQYWRGKNPNI